MSTVGPSGLFGLPGNHQIRRLQNTLARLVGVSRWDREKIVGDMLKQHHTDRVSYWIELTLAMGIATIGLVLNSTGVVIGAMLISPLMGPIVGLGMGLAVGSPFLTLRSLVRVLTSILGVILLAAFLTMLLPFREVTPEIAARTSPTALDLIVAAFCALAAGYTTARLRSDTAATAAGTAIGIALVPPLCVSGFGLGTLQLHIFGGALLLFTANLCAILFFSVALFMVLGFTMVDIARHEAEEIKTTGPIAQIAARARTFFGSRSGSVLRILMPAMLIAAIYVPLRVALREVAWQVEVRGDVTALLSTVAPGGQFVRTALTVEQHRVGVRLVMMGTPEAARQLEADLKARIAAIAGVVPSVEVVAVPDHDSLRQVADAVAAPLPSPAPVEPPPTLADVSGRVGELFATRWPAAAGELIAWKIGFEGGAPRLELTHSGTPLGPVATPLLAEALSETLETRVEVDDALVELGTWEAQEDVTQWLPKLALALHTARDYGSLRACVTLGPTTRRVLVGVVNPERDPKVAPETADAPAQPTFVFEDKPDPAGLAADAMLKALPGPNVELAVGEHWAVRLTRDSCPTATSEVGDEVGDEVSDEVGDEVGDEDEVVDEDSDGEEDGDVPAEETKPARKPRAGRPAAPAPQRAG